MSLGPDRDHLGSRCPRCGRILAKIEGRVAKYECLCGFIHIPSVASLPGATGTYSGRFLKGANDHSECHSRHFFAFNGEEICPDGPFGAEVVSRQETLSVPKGVEFTVENRALWGNGLGSPHPAYGLGSNQQYYDKAMLEQDFAKMKVKELVSDSLDTPDDQFGRMISGRLADLAVDELDRRRTDRLIDLHECYLIVLYAKRELVKELPRAKIYFNVERLKLATTTSEDEKEVLVSVGLEQCELG